MEGLEKVQKEQSKRNFLLQYAASLSAVLSMICVGMHLGWSSPSLPILFSESSEIPLTASEGSWLAAMVHTVAPAGVVAAVLLTDRIGRKRSLLLSSPLFFISWLGIAFAQSALVLVGSRILAGIATGLSQTAIPMYISEIVDKNIRGSLSSGIIIGIKFGMLLINIIGMYFSIKVTALIASVIPILHFATFWFMPESPRFYILVGKDTKAMASFSKLTRKQNSNSEISTLAASIRTQPTKTSGKLMDIFTPSNRKAFGLILCLTTIQHGSGFLPITFYCLTIFTQVGGGIQGSTATIIFFSLQFCVSMLCASLLDKLGRRPLLIVSVSISACALAGTGAYFYLKEKTNVDLTNFTYLPLIALMVFIVSCNIGLTFVPMTLVSEVFPLNIKAIGAGISTALFAGFSMVATKLFQVLKDEFGIYVPFLLFALSCAFGLLYIIYYVPETKGKSLEEVQMMLSGSNARKSVQHDTEAARDILLNSKSVY